MTDFDVAIVGAGPAGSATATLLALRGMRVAVMDRARFPRPKPCAEYLSPEAGRVLARLGILESLLGRHPARLAGMRITSPNGVSFVGRFADTHGFRRFSSHGLALPREVLDTLLLENAMAAGATDFQGTLIEGFSVHGDGVRIAIRRGRHREFLTAHMLVGADGLHSRIAHRLGVARSGARRRIALVTHATGVQGMTDVGEMHVTRGAYAGLAPVGGDVTNVAVVQDTMRNAHGTPSQRFTRAIALFPEVAGRLATSQLVSPVRAVGPFARWTSRATADRILLVGDAADFYDPFTGEGIYAALHGAELASDTLVDALERGAFGARALRGYDRARRRAFGGKWILERVIAGIISTPAVFNHVSRRLAQRPALADLLVGVTGDFVPARRVLSPSFLWQIAR